MVIEKFLFKKKNSSQTYVVNIWMKILNVLFFFSFENKVQASVDLSEDITRRQDCSSYNHHSQLFLDLCLTSCSSTCVASGEAFLKRNGVAVTVIFYMSYRSSSNLTKKIIFFSKSFTVLVFWQVIVHSKRYVYICNSHLCSLCFSGRSNLALLRNVILVNW